MQRGQIEGYFSQNSGLMVWDVPNESGRLSSNGLSDLADFWTDSSVLKVGSKGQDVKNLQFNLRLLGYTQAYITTYPTSGGKRAVEKELIIDGSFGAITENVVKQFQINQKLNLAPSTMGMVGQATKQAIVAAAQRAWGGKPRYYDPKASGVVPNVKPEVQTLPPVTIVANGEPPPSSIEPREAGIFNTDNKMLLYGGAAVIGLMALGKMIRANK